MNIKLLFFEMFFLVPVSFASTPEAWEAFYNDVTEACKEKSAFVQPEIVGKIVDTESQAIAIVQGKYTQTPMEGELGTVFCLYTKRTKAVEVVETSLLAVDWCSIHALDKPAVTSSEQSVKNNTTHEGKDGTTATGEWIVQAGSFRTQARARQLIAELKDKNFSAEIAKVGRWYAVRLASQPDESSAKRQLTELVQVAKVNGVILKQGKSGRTKVIEAVATPVPESFQLKWVVQAGSFLTTAKAEKMYNELKEKGISPRIVKNGKWYTVRLTPQENQQAAIQQLQQLRRVAKVSGVILKFR